MRKHLWLIPLLLISAGCCWLPAGDPPPGNIVHNPGGIKEIFQAENPNDASELFISALTMALLEHCPGAKIKIDSDEDSAFAARRVFISSAVISGNRESAAAEPWVLNSTVRDRIWTISLSHNGKTVWSDMVQCKFNPSLMF